MPICLHKLNLTQFRNYAALRLDFGGALQVVLSGVNGSGKTNILEAVSLLTPGKGLRGADLLDMKSSRAGAEENWAIAAEVETGDGERVRIGTGLARHEDRPDEKRRVVRIDGRDAKSQNELAELFSVVWLTPQMDRIFIEGASSRRKFLDRLVYSYEPKHAAHLSRYDKSLRERLKLLTQEKPADETWFDSLESQLAAESVVIAASRHALVQKLAQGVRTLEKKQSLFPSPLLFLSGWAENEIAKNRPALSVEEELVLRYKQSRALDRHSARSHEGAHKCDLQVFYGTKEMQAAQCSTGEQKALLTAILLAHAQQTRAEKGATPVLLLDEVCAHLDEARRDQLFGFLKDVQGQVFLTGTDDAIFRPLRGSASFFDVHDGHAAPQKRAEAV